VTVSTPTRIQRKHTKGWRMPDGAVYVGRPSKYGNPYVLDAWVSSKALPFFEFVVDTPATAVKLYARWIAVDPTVPLSGFNRHLQPPSLAEIRDELAGKDLACWCPLDQPCHADVLLRIANEEPG
jgi:hypothetical protein